MSEEDIEDIKLYEDDSRNKMKRGDSLDLSLKDPTLKKATIGVGWDLRAFEGEPIDLDFCVFLLDKRNVTRVDSDFVFYNNPVGSDGAVRHTGDSRTGAGDGDDEVVHINLQALPFDVSKIVFAISIYDLETDSNLNFDRVRNVFFRLVNRDTGHELFRYELDSDMGQHSALVIGELERVGPKWVFHAQGESIEGGLTKLATRYGIIVAEMVRG